MGRKANNNLRPFRTCYNCEHCHVVPAGIRLKTYQDQRKRRAQCSKGMWESWDGLKKTYTLHYLYQNRSEKLLKLSLQCEHFKSMEDD